MHAMSLHYEWAILVDTDGLEIIDESYKDDDSYFLWSNTCGSKKYVMAIKTQNNQLIDNLGM